MQYMHNYFSSILTPSSFGGLKVTLLQCIKLFMVLMTLLVFLNSRVNSRTRGGELKIFKPHSNNNVRAHSFACRHVNCWNELP